jgi:hypothetical protein
MPATYAETVEPQVARSVQFVQRSSAFWLDHLLDAYRQGRDPAAVVAQAARVEHIDSDTLRRAARRYLRGDQYVEALLLPAARPQAGVSSAALTR